MMQLQAGQDDDPALEEALGFTSFTQGQSKLGWLMNLNEVDLKKLTQTSCNRQNWQAAVGLCDGPDRTCSMPQLHMFAYLFV